MNRDRARAMDRIGRVVSLLRRRWLIVLIVAAIAVLTFAGEQSGLSWDLLRDRQVELEQWVALHPVLAPLAFVAATAGYLLLSLPAEGVLTAIGGMLFGTAAGAALSVAGTLLAALILFVALRRMLRGHLEKPQKPWFTRVQRRMEKDRASYLLMLRLLPVLPFALVSLLAVLARMRLFPYALATTIGVIPLCLVFASAGSELGALLLSPAHADLFGAAFDRALLPLIALAVLAFLPAARRLWRARAENRRSAYDQSSSSP